MSAAVAASLPARARRRVIVIPHGIDPDRITTARDAVAERPRTGDEVTVIAVASHRDAKNYPNLLHGLRAAIDLGASIRLVTVGDGPNLDTHRQLAQTLGAADFIRKPVHRQALLSALGRQTARLGTRDRSTP